MIGFESTEYTVTEDECYVELEIVMRGPSVIPILLEVQTQAGTAVGGLQLIIYVLHALHFSMSINCINMTYR